MWGGIKVEPERETQATLLSKKCGISSCLKTKECTRRVRMCCCGSRRRICICGTTTAVLVVFFSLVIAVLAKVINYPIPDVRARLQQASLANLCASSWELNITLEVYNSNDEISLSDTTVKLLQGGAPRLSLVVPGSIARSGWNVHRFSLPIWVDQPSFVKLLGNFSLVNNSESTTMLIDGWSIDIATTVSIPVIGLTLSKDLQFSLILSELLESTSKSTDAPTPASNSTSQINKVFMVLSPRDLTIGANVFSAVQGLELGIEQTATTNRTISVFGLPNEFGMPGLDSSYWNSHLEGGAVVILPPEIVLDLMRTKDLLNTSLINNSSAYLARVGGLSFRVYLKPVSDCVVAPGLLCVSRLRFALGIEESAFQMNEYSEDFWFNLTAGKCDDIFNVSNCVFSGADFTDIASELVVHATQRPVTMCPLMHFGVDLVDNLTLSSVSDAGLHNASKILLSLAGLKNASKSSSNITFGLEGRAPTLSRVFQVNPPSGLVGEQLWLGISFLNFYRVNALDSLYLGGGGLLNIYSYPPLSADGGCAFVADASIQFGVSLVPNKDRLYLGLVLNKGMSVFQSDITDPLMSANMTDRCYSFQVASMGSQSSLMIRLLHQVELAGRVRVGNVMKTVFDWIGANIDPSLGDTITRADGLDLAVSISYPAGFFGIPQVDLGLDILFFYYVTPSTPQFFAALSVASATGGFINKASVKFSLRDSPWLSPLGQIGNFTPTSLLSFLASSYASALPFPQLFRCALGIGAGFQLLFDFPFPTASQPALRILSQQISADSASPSPLCFCSTPSYLVSLQFRNVFYLPVSCTSWSVGGNVTLSAEIVSALTQSIGSIEPVLLETCASNSQMVSVRSGAATTLNFPACSVQTPCRLNVSSCPSKSNYNLLDPISTLVKVVIEPTTGTTASWPFNLVLAAQPY